MTSLATRHGAHPPAFLTRNLLVLVQAAEEAVGALRNAEGEARASRARLASHDAEIAKLREENAKLKEELINCASVHQLQLLEMAREKTRLSNLNQELEARAIATREATIANNKKSQTLREEDGSLTSPPATTTDDSLIGPTVSRLERATDQINRVASDLQRLSEEVQKSEAKRSEMLAVCEEVRAQCAAAREKIAALTERCLESETARRDLVRRSAEEKLASETLARQVEALSADLNASVRRQKSSSAQVEKIKAEFSLLALRYDALAREGLGDERLTLDDDCGREIPSNEAMMAIEDVQYGDSKRVKMALMDHRDRDDDDDGVEVETGGEVVPLDATGMTGSESEIVKEGDAAAPSPSEAAIDQAVI